ncbi:MULTISPECIES: NfeD family protein [unclassified Shewanella]|uniref:NfeD family protein n=1 Tax=unclassified Shewanella TaxID=196818 RepID=UPI001784215E|nr:hypothetical protein [Shewanella sp. WPAGA9]
MNFNQFINQAQLKQKVGTMNPIFALLSIIAIGLMSIVLLPFLIVFAVVSFIGLNLLGRKYLAPKMQPIFGQQAPDEVYRGDPNIQRERSVYQSDMFKQAGNHSQRSGRTFDHQPD